MKRPRSTDITAAELNAIEQDRQKPCELNRGRLVVREPVAIYHAVMTARVARLLDAHVAAHGLGIVMAGDPGCVLTRDPDTVRAPDIAFVRTDRIPDAAAAATFFEGAPDLVVEVLSPSNRTPDLKLKIEQYLAGGALVWVVDRDSRSVTVHAPGRPARRLREGETLDGETVVPGFRCDVSAFFWP